MAHGGRKQSSQVPGMVTGAAKGQQARGGAAGSGPRGDARRPSPAGGAGSGRQSVAQVRRSKGDRTQLIIGAVAVAVIIVIIVIGLVLYQKNTAVQGAGYGVSKSSTATVDDHGVITVSHGTPSLKLDVYEDGICPYCQEFETQYGQQIAKAIDQGQLTVQYHMVDFLNSHSASGTYSTRAYAALIAVAKDDGSKPGVFMAFHSALFNPKNQPKEGASSDLSNAQLASLAGTVGASSSARQAISSGEFVKAAAKDASANYTTLAAVAKKAGVSPGTPTVIHDGTPQETNDANWLTNLLPKAGATTGG